MTARDRAFVDALNAKLSAWHVRVLSAELGRGPGGLVWFLAVEDAQRLISTVHAQMQEDADSEAAVENVYFRLMARFARFGKETRRTESGT